MTRQPEDREKIERALDVARRHFAGETIEFPELVGSVANLLRVAKIEGDTVPLQMMLAAGATYFAAQVPTAPKADDDLDDLDDEPATGTRTSNGGTDAGSDSTGSSNGDGRRRRRATRDAGSPGSGSATDGPSSSDEEDGADSDDASADAGANDTPTGRRSRRRA